MIFSGNSFNKISEEDRKVRIELQKDLDSIKRYLSKKDYEELDDLFGSAPRTCNDNHLETHKLIHKMLKEDRKKSIYTLCTTINDISEDFSLQEMDIDVSSLIIIIKRMTQFLEDYGDLNKEEFVNKIRFFSTKFKVYYAVVARGLYENFINLIEREIAKIETENDSSKKYIYKQNVSELKRNLSTIIKTYKNYDDLLETAHFYDEVSELAENEKEISEELRKYEIDIEDSVKTLEREKSRNASTKMKINRLKDKVEDMYNEMDSIY